MHTCSTWSEAVHAWFWGYPPIICHHFFHFFRFNFFPGPISIRTDTVWAHLFLELSTDHFETMHICCKWSEDEGVGLGYPPIIQI